MSADCFSFWEFPIRTSPLDPTGDFRSPNSTGYSPPLKIPGVTIVLGTFVYQYHRVKITGAKEECVCSFERQSCLFVQISYFS